MEPELQLFFLAEQNRNAFRFRNRNWFRMQHKMEYKDKKITNESPTFWETMLLVTLERQGFVQLFLLLKNCAKYCLDPEPEPEQ